MKATSNNWRGKREENSGERLKDRPRDTKRRCNSKHQSHWLSPFLKNGQVCRRERGSGKNCEGCKLTSWLVSRITESFTKEGLPFDNSQGSTSKVITIQMSKQVFSELPANQNLRINYTSEGRNNKCISNYVLSIICTYPILDVNISHKSCASAFAEMRSRPEKTRLSKIRPRAGTKKSLV